ncbi:unnamed protein product [Penicillium olsonii]|nr:unnamed protein product [Penicillium olsonii]
MTSAQWTTPSSRARTGCLTCRSRKKKCDERKPVCTACDSKSLRCEWQQHIKWKPPLVPFVHAPVFSSYFDTSSSETPKPHSQKQDGRIFHINDLLGSSPDYQVFQSTSNMPYCHPSPSCPPPRMVQPSLLPQMKNGDSNLLNHYLQRTASCMDNGATTSNPFLVQLVPIAMSSEFIMQLILAQSCAHRAIKQSDIVGTDVAVQYNKAVCALRLAVDKFVTQTGHVDPLILTVGILVMCFTETTRGDTTGVIFNHITAANALLPNALFAMAPPLPEDLQKFLVGYYIYTACCSMISIDAHGSQEITLDTQLVQMAESMARCGYVGSVCGCWLDLLLMIPAVFDIGRSRLQQHTTAKFVRTEFSLIEYQIIHWKPTQTAAPDMALAGHVFQQAMLVYLYTAVEEFPAGPNGLYRENIDLAVGRAIQCLGQIDPASPVNTSLCWPIAVGGSCAGDPGDQHTLRVKLDNMAQTIGIGNMIKTRELLQYVWSRRPTGQLGLSEAMGHSRIFISFA